MPYTWTIMPFWAQILRTWSSTKGSSSSTTMTAFFPRTKSAIFLSGRGLVNPSFRMETPDTNSFT